MQNFKQQNEKLEFRQIVLSHLKRILEISGHELRDTTTYVLHPNNTEEREQEDTRLSYVQAIENLAYVLIPYYDKEMQKTYDECMQIMTAFYHRIPVILKEEYEKVCGELGKDQVGNRFAIEMKLEYAKKLFVALNLLLHRNDYLKSEIYGESDEEVVEGDEE